MFLSVCTPVGCHERLEVVRATLESVGKQTGGPIECILKLQGGHLAQELKAYASTAAFNVAVVTGEDRGIYDAYNRCVASARGEYVVFLGCGDELADAFVVEDLQEVVHRKRPDMTYGPVLLADAAGKIGGVFDNRCFAGRRYRFPWRNPCHSQGLVFRRTWIEARPYRTDVGPLADLVHTHAHRLDAAAEWVNRPIAIFRSGGVSTRHDKVALQRRLRGIKANCDARSPAWLWRIIANCMCNVEHNVRRATARRAGAAPER